MNAVASTPTRRIRRLWRAVASTLLLSALGASAVGAQPPATSSRGRDLEAEMNALKTQMQRFELQAQGASSRNPDFDAMLQALRARMDRLESPPSAGATTTTDRQIADLRRQLDEQQAELARMKRRNLGAGIAFALICACVCALWAISSGRRSGYWFLGGLFFNVLALFAALYHAGQDALSSSDRGEESGPATSAGSGSG